MIFKAYGAAFGILLKKPYKVLGISLLFELLTALAVSFGVLPIIYIPLGWLLEVGIAAVYLTAVNREEVTCLQLFNGFKDWKRVLSGVAWANLWILIWGMIPGAGIVFAAIRGYEYSFVPYILMTRQEVSPTEAMEISKKETKGYKKLLFGADMLVIGAVCVVMTPLACMGLIPYVGFLFLLILVLLTVVVSILACAFVGLYRAKLYSLILEDRARASELPPSPHCPNCGAEYAEGYAFCPACGQKLN